MVRALTLRLTSVLMTLASAAFPVAAGVGAYVFAEASQSEVAWIAGAGLAIAIAGMVKLPIGGDLSAAYAVVAALPLARDASGRLFDFPAQLAAVLAGLTALWVLRSSRGHDQAYVLGASVRRSAGFACYLLVSRFMDLLAYPEVMEAWKEIFVFLGAALVAFAVELGLGYLARRTRIAGDPLTLMVDLADLSVYASLTASGAMFGLAYWKVGWWALAVSMLPYAFAHGAFARFRDAKLTYSQMIKALGQIPEAAGHSRKGHAERCADLAVAVGAEFGMNSRDLERVEYAALMHDIGRISLNEPAVLQRGYTDSDIGAWGSEIIKEARYLEPVAEIVRRNHEPFRSPGQLRDDALPLASRIVRAVSAFDDALADTGSSLEAMEILHRGSAYEFDPAVTAALRTVIDRRGSLPRR